MAGEIYAVSHTITGEKGFRGQTMLTYTIEYPQFVTFSAMAGLRRINADYKQQAVQLSAYAQDRLYSEAVTDFISRQQEGFPFSPYELQRPFTQTYGQSYVLSLYLDEYVFTGGAHGNTLRTADTRDARTGEKIPLSALFRPGVDYEERILAVVIAEAERRAEAEPGTYDEDVAKLVVESFNPSSFYLTPAGIVIFYQQYEIAPYSTGIPTFLVPYGMVGAKVGR